MPAAAAAALVKQQAAEAAALHCSFRNGSKSLARGRCAFFLSNTQKHTEKRLIKPTPLL